MRRSIVYLCLLGACATGTGEGGRGGPGDDDGPGDVQGDDDGDGDGDRPGGDWGTEGSPECVGVGCDEEFDLDEDDARGVIQTPDGAITLGGDSALGQHIWIANTREGTVSKIDTRTRVEVARYATGPSSLTSPSRTTVGFSGDAVVANRDDVGAAVKFYGTSCPDRDGDGTVETSAGPHDVLPWGQDECMAWSTPVGAVARGSAYEVRSELDDVAREYVWIGTTTDQRIVEIDADTGALTGRSVESEEAFVVYPYGIAIGANNTLWTFGYETSQWGASNRLVAIDTEDMSMRTWPCPQSFYGIAVDPEGRVWIGGTVSRFDPETEQWTNPASLASGGGIAVDADGNAYTGEEGQGVRIDGDDLTVTSLPIVGGHGWAIDFDGFVWSVPYEGSVAHVSDPETLEEIATVEGLVGAYTYSDMTGFQLANAMDPVGTYAHVFEGCGNGTTTWQTVSWEADLPPGSSIAIAVKTADDAAALALAPLLRLGAAPPDEPPLSIEDAIAEAGATPGRLLWLQITLQSDTRENAPIVRALEVSARCDPLLQ